MLTVRSVITLILVAVLCLARPVAAQTLTILHSFGDGSVANDGADPTAELVLAATATSTGRPKRAPLATARSFA
jgi:hypothetical protein